jgi:hypothetical protein
VEVATMLHLFYLKVKLECSNKMAQEVLDEDYVIRFIDKYTNQSPEKLAK